MKSQGITAGAERWATFLPMATTSLASSLLTTAYVDPTLVSEADPIYKA